MAAGGIRRERREGERKKKEERWMNEERNDLHFCLIELHFTLLLSEYQHGQGVVIKGRVGSRSSIFQNKCSTFPEENEFQVSSEGRHSIVGKQKWSHSSTFSNGLSLPSALNISREIFHLKIKTFAPSTRKSSLVLHDLWPAAKYDS